MEQAGFLNYHVGNAKSLKRLAVNGEGESLFKTCLNLRKESFFEVHESYFGADSPSCSLGCSYGLPQENEAASPGRNGPRGNSACTHRAADRNTHIGFSR